MPANLTPQYYDAEKRFRAAKTTEDKVMALEEMLAIMPKHKGTDHLKADLRRKIARLTQESERKGGAKRASMLVEKEGAAQVVLLGLPNAGKSQIVAAITNAAAVVAEYPFTTQMPLPGMMEYENIKIQLVDTPPLTDQPPEWWLRNTIIRADGLLIVLDAGDDPLAQLEAIITQLREMRVSIGAPPPPEDDAELIIYAKKALVVCNKRDLADKECRQFSECVGDKLPVAAVAAALDDGLDELRQAIYDMLDIIRIYTKAPGKKPELDDPIVLAKGSTLEQAAEQVHKDFRARLKYARIWGSGKHDGVMVRRDHVLQDGDVVELHQSK